MIAKRYKKAGIKAPMQPNIDFIQLSILPCLIQVVDLSPAQPFHGALLIHLNFKFGFSPRLPNPTRRRLKNLVFLGQLQL